MTAASQSGVEPEAFTPLLPSLLASGVRNFHFMIVESPKTCR